jgi:predicted metalloendopeptidase
MAFENLVVVVGGLVLLYLWFLSMRTILATRREGPQRRAYLEDKLVKELREVMEKEKETLGEADIAGILTEVYDDLYARIADEEKERKREIQSLKAELRSLREEINSMKER